VDTGDHAGARGSGTGRGATGKIRRAGVRRIRVKAGHVHHLTIHVAFTSASSTKALTIHRTLARCAAVHHVATPRFTG
jgi:hypothetical protein